MSLCSQLEDLNLLVLDIIDDMSSTEKERELASQSLHTSKAELLGQFNKIVGSSAHLRKVLGVNVCQRLQSIF